MILSTDWGGSKTKRISSCRAWNTWNAFDVVSDPAIIERTIGLFCRVVCVVPLPFWNFCWCRGFCHRTESDPFLLLLCLARLQPRTDDSLSVPLLRLKVETIWRALSKPPQSAAYFKQKRSTEGYSKFKSPETRQVQERLVSTLEHMQVPKWDRTRCPEE